MLHFFHAQTTATVKRLRLAAAGNTRVESGEANQRRASEHSRSRQFTLLRRPLRHMSSTLLTESRPNMIARYTTRPHMLRSLVCAPGVHGSSVYTAVTTAGQGLGNACGMGEDDGSSNSDDDHIIEE